MQATSKGQAIFRCLALLVIAILCLSFVASNVLSQEQPAASAERGATKALGAIKSIAGRTLTLAAQAGDISVTVMDGARLLRIPPGETDLKQAAPLALEDLQTGDRILVRGKWGPDGKTLLASSVIAMKQQDIVERQTRERAEWQQHSVGGLVSAEDPAAGTVTITVPTLGTKRSVVVHIAKDTILRRYAPDSVKFADAQPSPLDKIAVGDQLRARGTRTPDGNELSAEEVVSGSFRNIAGTIVHVDSASSTISVNDLATKKPVVVKVTGESQLRRLPPGLAQQIAVRLKGASGESETPSRERVARTPEAGAAGGSPSFKGPGSQGERAAGGPGAPDLQQVISRLPAISLTDLQRSEAVMLVGTAGTPDGGVTAITLLAGVEPILEASPKGQSILTPWSLNTSGDTGQP